MQKNDSFYISYNNEPVYVESLSIGTQVLYRVNFHNKPLLLSRAKDANGAYFWTSIPEGKQKLAEQIGPLIETYIKSL